ncbi:wd domain containing [Trichoderma arundinaceum]|uniref:Wd domain containing n=1 Tax=Trichoderma arundinaceum TaxID=490622 RepID=A0A395NRS4_TRIAR|nr:wd domain containing [Trichoderma arundinaceum]
MRPGSLSLPPDRQLDENDIPDHHDCYHHSYHDCYNDSYHLHYSQPKHEDNRGRHQAQDAAFYAPESSNNTKMYYEQYVQHDEYHQHDQGGTYDAEEVMTPAPVDGGASSNEHVEYNAHSYLPYGSEYYGHAQAHVQSHHYPPMQTTYDQDMSDSDGGAPLNNYNGAAQAGFAAGGVAASNAHFHHPDGLINHEEEMEREDDYDEDDGEDEEEDEEDMMDQAENHMQPVLNDPIPSIIQYLQGTGPPPLPAAFSQEFIDQAANYLLHQPLSPDELSLDEDDEELLMDPFPPVHMSNPNPSILGSENYGLIDFLRFWAYGNVPIAENKLPRPGIHRVLKQATSGVERVFYSDLRGDGCDMQGLDWESMNTTRYAAREVRRYTYKNYVNKQGSDIHQMTEVKLPCTESFFRFKKMDVRRDISLAHFQLRSVLACPTRTHAFYPSVQGINVLNTATKKTSLAMNLRAFPGMAGPAISTLDAGCGVLMGGTFNGDYFLQALGAEDKKSYSEGQISTDISGITNHIKIYRPRRSGSPMAAIASNDQGFRLMDLQTEKFTAKFAYPFALNCSAMSPDGRLRVVVGDDLNVLITNAETGEVLQQLSGHRDYGFACDWSDNGYTVATGFQDKTVKIWDARRWHNSHGVSTPVCTITTEMAGVRNLRFSPTGSGRPILAAAEEADYINLIDADTFCTKQVIDVFGEIGGVAFTNEGQDLNILCCDAHRGGLLQFERCSFGVDEPLTGGWQRTVEEKKGISTTWDDVQRRRPPTYIDGPGVF